MIISSITDYREAARRKLPRFLFDYIEGGAFTEQTLKANTEDLAKILLRQRVLKNVGHPHFETELLGQKLAMPIILSPIGLTGMYARRGEVQVAKAAAQRGVPFVLSTVSLCSLEEVSSQSTQPIWFQLYILKDRGFMQNVLERAQACGVTNLIFTVDMSTPSARYRDLHSGMAGPFAHERRLLQAMLKPSWAYQVGIRGRPHDLGNISAYLNKKIGLEDYISWLNNNFNPCLSWSDLEWVRNFWSGPLLIKGILDPEDAKDAARFGADGIIVSNHGGRQLDGVSSTVKALPKIADKVHSDLTVLVDSGIRSGLDVIRMLALGAHAVLIGRPTVYALAARGQAGVEHMLDIIHNEMSIAMTLMGVNSCTEINQSHIRIPYE
ncbi:FMN-dependent L-lactate dehydrogenase LldD [Legionella sp. PC997]|uniref:FMN-dependent L-lactate dehydrogenase LldD n=1 Tax=Legionella sp. PC997 TaxID=2755562 RepID=UPI0015FDB498|nr:FMN-dependent L-lactate dehydrogenase LldD [Legionella sp. PC997]QMT59091.1 L-lactate dehydrogenase [Legionella sp. PC997]